MFAFNLAMIIGFIGIFYIGFKTGQLFPIKKEKRV